MSCSHQHSSEHAADISIPTITVNGDSISAESIANEIQYHPSDNAEQALLAAVRAMVVKQLLASAVHTGNLLEECNGDEEQAISKLLEQNTLPAKASEEECQQFYRSNLERFRSAPYIAARHILIAANPDDFDQRDQAKQTAEQLLQQLSNNIDSFAALAEEHSDCPSKSTGGELGQLSQGQTTPEFERQVFSLKEGLSPHPIESRYGYHVIDIQKRIDGEIMPYESVAAKVANLLDETAQRKAISVFIRHLIDNAEIVGIDKEQLSPSFDN